MDLPHEIAANVIIPAHNAGHVLAQQLAALSQQVGAPPFDVTVVTNRCRDNTDAVAAAANGPGLRVRVVDAPLQASAGYARNVGVAQTSADYLLFCDADDVVGANWVAAMYQRCAVDGFDVVGGRIDADPGVLPAWLAAEAMPDWQGQCSLIHLGHQYAITASMGCRRDVFEVLDGFDQTLPGGAGGEDADFGIRSSIKGFTFGEAPHATVQYRTPSSIAGFLSRTYRYSYNNEPLMVRYAVHEPVLAAALVTRPVKTAGYAVLVDRRLDPRVVGFRMANAFASALGRWRYQRDHRHVPTGP